MRKEKLRIEIEQAEKICDNSETIWGWGSPAGQCRVKRRLKCFEDFLGNETVPTVLEIGGGTGIFSRRLMKQDIKLVALDISSSFIKRSREFTGKRVRYVLGDAECIPLKDGSCDAIFGISVLHHLNVENTLREIFRVLKKDGKAFFTEPNLLNPQVFVSKNVDFIRRRYHWVPHETAFVRWSLQRKFDRAGFSAVSIKNFDFVHPAIPAPLVPLGDRVGQWLEQIPLIKEISGSLLITVVKK